MHPTDPTPYRIMTVCTGNICRSPMAHYVLEQALEDAGQASVTEVSSSGISDEETGNRMDPRAAAELDRLGYTNHHGHRAQPFPDSAWQSTDLFLVADLNHLRTLRRWAPTPEHRDRLRLLRSFDPASVEPGTAGAGAAEDQLGMADPWYGDESDFAITRDQVLASVPGVVGHVATQLHR